MHCDYYPHPVLVILGLISPPRDCILDTEKNIIKTEKEINANIFNIQRSKDKITNNMLVIRDNRRYSSMDVVIPSMNDSYEWRMMIFWSRYFGKMNFPNICG